MKMLIFVISIIDKKLSDFICIYKFKESILKEDRIKNLQKCDLKIKEELFIKHLSMIVLICQEYKMLLIISMEES